MAEHRAHHENEDKVIEKVVENSTVDIPPVMTEKHLDRLVEDYGMRLMYQGLSLEKYRDFRYGHELFQEQFRRGLNRM